MFIGGPNIRKDYHIEEGEEVGLQTAPPLTQPRGKGTFPKPGPEPVDRRRGGQMAEGEGGSKEITVQYCCLGGVGTQGPL